MHNVTEELLYSPHKASTNVLAMDNTFLNLNVKIFHNALYYVNLFLKLVSGQYVAQCFNICLPVMFNAIALPSFIHTFSYIVFIYGITEIATNTKYTAAMVPDCRTVT